MTNVEIIERTKQEQGITEEIHTFKAWNELGFKVKRGEKAIMMVEIWKPRATRVIGITQMEEEIDENDENVKNKGRFFLKKSHFFGRSQVE